MYIIFVENFEITITHDIMLTLFHYYFRNIIGASTKVQQ